MLKKESAFTASWNNYLEYLGEKDKDIYFTEEYVKLYESADDSAECFVYKSGDKIFLFPYLKRKIALLNGEYSDFETAYGYGGPLTNAASPSFITEALNEFRALAQEKKIVAGFIRFHPLLNNHSAFVDSADVFFIRKTVAMNLSLNEQNILGEIHTKHRNSIRKAIKSNLTYVLDEELRYLDSFKQMYKSTMDKIKADDFYYFSDEYYQRLKNLKKNIFLGLVLLDKEIISGALFMSYGMYGHYHLSGSLEKYKYYNANNLLLHKTALLLRERNVKLFHLGGGNDNSQCGTISENDTLYKFKRRFTKNEYSFYAGRLILDPSRYSSLCRMWEDKFPHKKEKYGNFYLKYRFLD